MLLLTLFCHTAPPGSAPVDHIESDIWNIDTQTNDISVQWIDDSGGRKFSFHFPGSFKLELKKGS